MRSRKRLVAGAGTEDQWKDNGGSQSQMSSHATLWSAEHMLDSEDNWVTIATPGTKGPSSTLKSLIGKYDEFCDSSRSISEQPVRHDRPSERGRTDHLL